MRYLTALKCVAIAGHKFICGHEQVIIGSARVEGMTGPFLAMVIGLSWLCTLLFFCNAALNSWAKAQWPMAISSAVAFSLLLGLGAWIIYGLH